MKNFVQSGHTITYTNSTGDDIASGAVVVLGSFIGIAITDIADGATGELMTEGVFTLPKTNPLAIAQGDKLYWDATAALITKDATDTPIGTAHKVAGSTDDEVNVSIYENASNGQLAAVVAAVSTADGTDLTTTEALANQLKTTVNNILTSLKNAGLMASS